MTLANGHTVSLLVLTAAIACSADDAGDDLGGSSSTATSDTTSGTTSGTSTAEGSSSTSASSESSTATATTADTSSGGSGDSTTEGSTGVAACGEPHELADWPSSGFVAAFTAAGEHGHVWIDNEAANAYVVSWLLEPDVPFGIPGGPIELDGTYNPGYSYRLDPAQVSIAEIWTEVCDAAPCYIEADPEAWFGNPGDWCPWGFTVETIYDCRGGDGQSCSVVYP
jgi:hypothetical protein